MSLPKITIDEIVNTAKEITEEMIEREDNKEFVEFFNSRTIDVYSSAKAENQLLPYVIREQLILSLFIGYHIGRKQATFELTNINKEN